VRREAMERDCPQMSYHVHRCPTMSTDVHCTSQMSYLSTPLYSACCRPACRRTRTPGIAHPARLIPHTSGIPPLAPAGAALPGVAIHARVIPLYPLYRPPAPEKLAPSRPCTPISRAEPYPDIPPTGRNHDGLKAPAILANLIINPQSCKYARDCCRDPQPHTSEIKEIPQSRK
jgi:hypothetical protein